jgi:hypothetical protein
VGGGWRAWCPRGQEKLERMNECFIEEYQVRREVLVKRLDVTLHALSCSTKRQVR